MTGSLVSFNFMLCGRLTRPKAIVLAPVKMLQLSIRPVQTINEPRVDTHSTPFLWIRRDPVGCTAARSAAMEFDPVLVPSVGSGRAFPHFECNLVE